MQMNGALVAPVASLGGGGGEVLIIVVAAALAVRIGIRVARTRRRAASAGDDPVRPNSADAWASVRQVPGDGRPPVASAVSGASAVSAVSAEPAVPAVPSPAPSVEESRAPVASEVLSIRDLVVAYGSKRAVDGVSFQIHRNEIFGLLGPNGAGKTSTLSAIEGLVRPRSGSVVVDGIDVSRHPTAARAKLGVQLQSTSFQSELTITQIVRLYAGLYGVDLSATEIAARLTGIGLGGHATRLFKQLSGGQQQRLSLMIALVHSPVLLLLDEPTTGLDPQARRQFWSRIERIRDSGGSILLTTHSMEEAQAVCERVAIVDHGQLLATGAPRALIAEHRDDPLVRAAAHGDVTLEDVFIGLTGGEIRD